MQKPKGLPAVSSEGDNCMVYKTVERDGSQKVYSEIEREEQAKAENKPLELGDCEKCMLDNDTYNLMEQLEMENRSLWRIKNSYKNDASTDDESRRLWSFIEKDKEKVVRLLTEKVRERL